MPENDKQNGILQFASAGVEFFVILAVMIVVGYFADDWLGTLPWLTLAGVGVGFSAALYHLIRQANSIRSTKSRNEEGPSDES